jgi:hypothetical protein
VPKHFDPDETARLITEWCGDDEEVGADVDAALAAQFGGLGQRFSFASGAVDALRVDLHAAYAKLLRSCTIEEE